MLFRNYCYDALNKIQEHFFHEWRLPTLETETFLVLIFLPGGDAFWEDKSIFFRRLGTICNCCRCGQIVAYLWVGPAVVPATI